MQQILCVLLITVVCLAINYHVRSTQWLKFMTYWIMIISLVVATVMAVRWVFFQ